jgi:hypothetical protein
MGLRETSINGERPNRRVFADAWFASVETALALRDEMGVNFTGPIKMAHKKFPIEAMRWTLATMHRGDHLVLKNLEHENLWAIGWHDIHYKCYVTTNGTTLPGKPAPKKRQDRHGRTYHLPIARPHVLAKYQNEMGYVDRHNQFRQGILHLPSIWKTKRWQTRIQLEILALTLVDTFLVCRKLMPRWQTEGDEESIFWKFVCELLPQIDSRGREELFHEPEEMVERSCKMVRIGTKRTVSGVTQGFERAIQMRCTYCGKRNKRNNMRGRSTLTSWCSTMHATSYACKTKTCWEEHLQEVRQEHQDEALV